VVALVVLALVATALPAAAAPNEPWSVRTTPVDVGSIVRSGVVLPIATSTAADWAFDAAEFNGDGVADVVAVRFRNTASSKTEVSVFDGRTGARLTPSTPTWLNQVDLTSWAFQAGDFDGDGDADLYALWRFGGNAKTEAHVIDVRTGGALLSVATVIGHAAVANWQFDVADGIDADTRPDIHMFSPTSAGMGSGRVEWYRATSVSNFQTFDLARATAYEGGRGADRAYGIGDFDRDGVNDVYRVDTGLPTGTSSILSAVRGVNDVKTPDATMEGPALSLGARPVSFADGNNDRGTDVYQFRVSETASGQVEVSVLSGAPDQPATSTALYTARYVGRIGVQGTALDPDNPSLPVQVRLRRGDTVIATTTTSGSTFVFEFAPPTASAFEVCVDVLNTQTAAWSLKVQCAVVPAWTQQITEPYANGYAPVAGLIRQGLVLPYDTVNAAVWRWRAGDVTGDGRADAVGVALARFPGGKMVATGINGVTGAVVFLTTLNFPAVPEADLAEWDLQVGDWDNGNEPMAELFLIDRDSGGRTDLHVLEPSTGQLLYQRTTALMRTPANEWSFAVADGIDSDKRADLHAINHNRNGRTAWLRLPSVGDFQGIEGDNPTGLLATNPAQWAFGIGDYDRNGINDLYAINRTEGVKTGLHIFRGEDPMSYQVNAPALSDLYATNPAWQFSVADHNADGSADVLAVNTAATQTGNYEAFFLNGDRDDAPYGNATFTRTGQFTAAVSVVGRDPDTAGNVPARILISDTVVASASTPASLTIRSAPSGAFDACLQLRNAQSLAWSEQGCSPVGPYVPPPPKSPPPVVDPPPPPSSPGAPLPKSGSPSLSTLSPVVDRPISTNGVSNWDRPAIVTYQWYRCHRTSSYCERVVGIRGTFQTYTPVAVSGSNDAGLRLRLRVTVASAANPSFKRVYSLATGVVNRPWPADRASAECRYGVAGTVGFSALWLHYVDVDMSTGRYCYRPLDNVFYAQGTVEGAVRDKFGSFDRPIIGNWGLAGVLGLGRTSLDYSTHAAFDRFGRKIAVYDFRVMNVMQCSSILSVGSQIPAVGAGLGPVCAVGNSFVKTSHVIVTFAQDVLGAGTVAVAGPEVSLDKITLLSESLQALVGLFLPVAGSLALAYVPPSCKPAPDAHIPDIAQCGKDLAGVR